MEALARDEEARESPLPLARRAHAGGDARDPRRKQADGSDVPARGRRQRRLRSDRRPASPSWRRASTARSASSARDYPGFFPFGDTDALAALLWRAETDAAFLAELARRCAELEPLFSRERERAAWADLLRVASPAGTPRHVLVETGVGASSREAFARDVREGLSRSRKSLPCRWFYDREGSRLFEEICTLAEYEIPRAETKILEGAADEIAGTMAPGAASSSSSAAEMPRRRGG